ncbi:hypothetical protein [Mycobacterium uberis]|uniref:hypothetical protein n=1 Tax=Mycobacterium uberis TaxID=2162698 RepID=UPI001FB36A34|nr:hypothetical protein [Mycobacterium uberis]
MKDLRYGLASFLLLAAVRVFRGESTTPIALTTADIVHISAGNIRPAFVLRTASSGIAKVLMTIPNGCVV